MDNTKSTVKVYIKAKTQVNREGHISAETQVITSPVDDCHWARHTSDDVPRGFTKMKTKNESNNLNELRLHK